MGGMGGGGGPLGMGKSKSKIQMEPDTGVTFEDVAGCDQSKLELEEVASLHDLAVADEDLRVDGGEAREGAVAPPDAPGRILLDASGLSPDAGEAFAATVFAAAEAPRGRVIP